MKGTIYHQQPHFVVIDNFLSQEDHLSLYRHFKNSEFEFVHQEKKVKAFKLTDGNPLWSAPVLSDPYEKNTLCAIYPTQTPLDALIGMIKEMVPTFSSIVGKQGEDWAYFFSRPYLYPQGCGLNWHTDGKYFAPGAFVYYAHPEWDPDWGGELLMSPPETKLFSQEEPEPRSNWGNNHYKTIIMDHGVGHYILPKPNRLVLMMGMIFHTIKKVDISAGDNLRMTIQGFFQDPAKLLQKEEEFDKKDK